MYEPYVPAPWSEPVPMMAAPAPAQWSSTPVQIESRDLLILFGVVVAANFLTLIIAAAVFSIARPRS